MAIYLGKNHVATVGGLKGTNATINYQTKTVDPSEESQLIKPDEGYALSGVTVNAISKTFIGSGITRKTSATYTPNNNTQVINAGQYLEGSQAIAPVPTETKTITANGTYTPTSGKYFSSVTVETPTLPSLTEEGVADDLLYGKQLISSSNKKVTGTMTNNGNITQTLKEGTLSYTIPKGYHAGSGTVAIDDSELSNITAENIKSGVRIFGIDGTYEGEGGNATLLTATATGANSTTLTFSGLSGEPTMYTIIPTATISISTSTSSAITGVEYDGNNTRFISYKYASYQRKITYTEGSKATYSNGSLTITSTSAIGNFANNITYKLLYITDAISSGGSSGGSTSSNIQSNKTVTPTSFPYSVTPDNGYNGMAKVTVNTPTGYVKPTGTLTITSNVTNRDVSNYQYVTVAVSASSSGTAVKTSTASAASANIGSSVKYSSNEPAISGGGSSSISLAFDSSTSLTISKEADCDVLKGKYISTGTTYGTTTSATFYYIPPTATFTVSGSSFMKTVTCNSAQKVTLEFA